MAKGLEKGRQGRGGEGRGGEGRGGEGEADYREFSLGGDGLGVDTRRKPKRQHKTRSNAFES